MNSSIKTLALLAVAGIIFLSGCGKEPQAEAAKAAPEVNQEKAPATSLKLTAVELKTAGVKIEPVVEQEQQATIVLTATIQSNQDKLAHVAPRVAGRLVKVNANLGQSVRQGQVLAQLDSIDLGEAHSAWLQAESEARLTEANFSRIDKLYADQIVSQKDYLSTKSENEKAKTALRAARDKLRMLGVSPTESNSAISVFPLTAPFSGTVIEKDAVLGELAQPDKSLFTVADLSTVWIEADLYEKDLGKVRLGAETDVTVTAYPNEVFKGRLTYISNILDKETRTLKARVEVRNPENRLKPEMFASAAIHTGSSSKALRMPEDAVLLIQGQPTVFIANDNGFEPRVVEIDERTQGAVTIKSGITAGERVVVKGAYALKARMLKSQIGEAD